MKIALDVAQTCISKTGCGVSEFYLAQALASKLKNELILYHQFGSWINQAPEQGIQIDGVASPFIGTPPSKAIDYWHKAAQSTNFVHQGNPDIIHSLGFICPPKGSSKLVYTLHDIAFWDCPQFTTEHNRLLCQENVLLALQQADGFIFPSHFTQEQFLQMFGDVMTKQQQHYSVIPWAGRFPFPPKKQKTWSKKNPWLFIGSVEPRKNIENILSALEIYQSHNSLKRPLLLIGGNGWKSEHTFTRIKKMEARGWLNFLGYQSDEDLLKHYKNAYALIWPSHYEGFGLPIIEAMSQATPVITSSQTCIPEVGGSAAIYASSSKPEEIATRMLMLDNNPAQYHFHSRESRKQATKFSWEQTARMHIDFYDRILKTCP